MGLIGILLLPLILGWLLIGAALLLTPLFGTFYLSILFPEKFRLTEKEIEDDGVLIVDDQYMTVIPLIKLLEQAQIPIKYVADGFEAIRELKNKRYRLVFMDYYMPMITGLEALARIDQVLCDDTHKTPVILYTGAEISEKEKCRFKHVSIVDSWNKSLDFRELNSRLARVLVKCN